MNTPRQKPLADLSTRTPAQWIWVDHVLERMQERGIGVFEVLSALYDPDWTRPSKYVDSNVFKATRGDIEVVYDPIEQTIITVTDRLNGTRDEPRRPLAPAIPSSPVPVPAQPSRAHEKPELPVLVPVQESESTMVTTSEVRSRRPRNRTKVGPHSQSARQRIRTWIAEQPAGTIFSIQDLLAVFPQFTGSAVRQAVVLLSEAGGPIASVAPGKRTGQYQVLGGPVTTRPIPPTMAAAESATTAALPTVGQAVGHTRAVFELVDPPSKFGAPGSELADFTLAHLREVLNQIQPGQAAKVLEIEGTVSAGSHRAGYLRRRLRDSGVEIVSRLLKPPSTAKGNDAICAIYVRKLAEPERS